jgi:hypothetical protein
MPVIANKVSTDLLIKVKTGTDATGNDVLSTQTFKKVKNTAVDDDIFSVAQTIGALESTPVISVMRTDNFELVSQA